MTMDSTHVAGAFLLSPQVFGDARGFFLEMWNRRTYRDLGIDADFVQDNHSRSSRGVLRGLHYQSGPHAQGKLVWVSSGVVFDAFVDLREGSPTFGKWDGRYLTAERHERLWVPPGCAHGFFVVSDVADFHYKCTNYYSPKDERVLQWNDPDIGIQWPLAEGLIPLLSDRDALGVSFQDCEKYDATVLFANGGDEV